jgi:excinuclease UvrABC helicase subunit UvrB
VAVRGVHPGWEGLLDVRVVLNASPPPEWKNFFDNPSALGIRVAMHPPELVDREVKIRPPDEQLEAFVEHIDARIEEANRRYDAEVVPSLRKELARQKQETEVGEARVDEARRRAKDL